MKCTYLFTYLLNLLTVDSMIGPGNVSSELCCHSFKYMLHSFSCWRIEILFFFYSPCILYGYHFSTEVRLKLFHQVIIGTNNTTLMWVLKLNANSKLPLLEFAFSFHLPHILFFLKWKTFADDSTLIGLISGGMSWKRKKVRLSKEMKVMMIRSKRRIRQEAGRKENIQKVRENNSWWILFV